MARRALVRAIAAAVVVAVAAAPARAQGRWYDPYQKGVDAFAKQRWQEAVDNLKRAVGIDPKAEAHKRVEGVFFEDYFPYYYLGAAYLKLHDLDNAGQNLAKAAAGPKMPGSLADDLKQAQADLAAALAAQNQPKAGTEPARPAARAGEPPRGAPPPSTPATAKPAETPKPEPANPPAGSARFDQLAQQAADALAAQRWLPAINQYEELQRLDAAEFQRRGFGPSLDEAKRGHARVLVGEANRMVASGQLSAAQTRYEDALRFNPQAAGARNGLDAIGSRRKQYGDATQAAAAAGPGQATLAAEKLQQAKDADPEQFAKDNLQPQLDAAQRAAEALTRKPAAPAAASSSGLPAAPPAPAAPVTRAAVPVRDAIAAFLRGEADQTIQLLGAPAQNDQQIDPAARAHAHAFLAAAYAAKSIEARTANERDRLVRLAVEQYRLALGVNPSYQLPQQYVSPAIQSILAGARR